MNKKFSMPEKKDQFVYELPIKFRHQFMYIVDRFAQKYHQLCNRSLYELCNRRYAHGEFFQKLVEICSEEIKFIPEGKDSSNPRQVFESFFYSSTTEECLDVITFTLHHFMVFTTDSTSC